MSDPDPRWLEMARAFTRGPKRYSGRDGFSNAIGDLAKLLARAHALGHAEGVREGWDRAIKLGVGCCDAFAARAREANDGEFSEHAANSAATIRQEIIAKARSIRALAGGEKG